MEVLTVGVLSISSCIQMNWNAMKVEFRKKGCTVFHSTDETEKSVTKKSPSMCWQCLAIRTVPYRCSLSLVLSFASVPSQNPSELSQKCLMSVSNPDNPLNLQSGGWMEMQDHECWINSDDGGMNRAPGCSEWIRESRSSKCDVREATQHCTSTSTMDNWCWIWGCFRDDSEGMGFCRPSAVSGWQNHRY